MTYYSGYGGSILKETILFVSSTQVEFVSSYEQFYNSNESLHILTVQDFVFL